MARPTGLEPVTDSLEGCCSIQLSYGRKTFRAARLPNLFSSVKPQIMFQALFERLFSDTWQEIPIPPEFAHRTHPQSQGELILNYRTAQHACGDLRAVHIFGPKIQIVNVFFFPHPTVALPVYALEFVVLGKRPIVAVIDLPDLHGEFAWGREKLQETHAQFPLQNASDPPNWYEASRSHADFFLRPTVEELIQLEAVHECLWEQLVAQFSHPPTCTSPADHHSNLHHYRNLHCAHSPGIPLLNQCFSKEWTSQFLTNYLFS